MFPLRMTTTMSSTATDSTAEIEQDEVDYLRARKPLEDWRAKQRIIEPEAGQIRFHSAQDAVEFTANQLLHSQTQFIFSASKDTLAISGVGTGKTIATLVRAFNHSYYFENNFGLILRDTYSSLENTTMKDFNNLLGDLVVEEQKATNIVKIANAFGGLSSIGFNYLRTSRPGTKHMAGANLGWYCCEQLEDNDKSDWDYLDTRLRLQLGGPKVRRARWANANPKGKDWIFKRYIEPAVKLGRYRKKMVPGALGEDAAVEEWWATRDLYAIRSPTEENVHLPTGYIEDILASRSKEYIDRFLHGSFDEWGGKIYKAYSYDSIHNIDEFPIPEDWPSYIWIDVGGDHPWAVLVARQDPYYGDVFITNEYYGPDLMPHQVIEWIHSTASGAMRGTKKPDRYIIDPQNRGTVWEFLRYGVLVEAARKGEKVPKILHVADYMRRKKGRMKTLPQKGPDGSYRQQVFEDAPHMWVFKRCENWRTEHDGWQWDRDLRTDSPKNSPIDKDDHTADATLYGMRILQPVQTLAKTDPNMEMLKKFDPLNSRAAQQQMEAKRGGPEKSADWSEFTKDETDEVDFGRLKRDMADEYLT
jgi:phage terminase large subunit